ncbi:putative structural protein [Erwinia phage pEa_SNUABM_50]|uniref:Structural protein n=4 Tax=Eneladusvirus BF TaxID=2560751 RepID=A0A1S6UAN3_9CAUD|nr:virion structural protein [Serratia phage BF]QOI71205.1 putative structural protein [Erwinia phage pEa_SNUABM_12]QOI71749.1 putative structural protein [Erwinia phage pEa_SNUABM_47]QOI72288.1 putative structural protein [Erwinia phage pEa_SNUABM_50]QXO11414.1 hypothetical protein pEaSNUABM19_00268 [Erwinia phage pEa_SNUABM_19]QXO11962.1 hypothetical protein pEaSNUABM44_00266 [Erwinia phage pEa_SNUABM_44]
MLERINGFSESGVLGYFYGKNALVSIAIGGADDVVVKVTGAVASFTELQRFLNTTDADVIIDFLNDKGVVRVDGTEFVSASLSADYTAAYAAQTNVKRVIDIVQQRAVILSTSDTAAAVAVSGFKNAPSGVTGAASVADANVVTFLVERANVFDKDLTTFQGVPAGTIDEGRLLIDDLTGVPMLTSTGAEVILASSATAATAGNFAIKVYKTIPALSL